MTKGLKEAIVYLKSKKILPVYCPNESLGTDGPFIQLDTFEEIEHMIKIEDSHTTKAINENEDLFIADWVSNE
jgi:hypothetical protein